MDGKKKKWARKSVPSAMYQSRTTQSQTTPPETRAGFTTGNMEFALIAGPIGTRGTYQTVDTDSSTGSVADK